MRGKELAALWTAIDDVTDGAHYAFRYECETNGWTPHLWVQTPAEGSPGGLTRIIFLGTGDGRTRYWETALVSDTDSLAVRIKATEVIQDAARAAKRIRAGLERLDAGLPPDEPRVVLRDLN